VAVAERFGMTVRKILVDDGSRDGSAETFATALSGSWEIVRLSRNFGKEAAVLAGLDHSRGDMVLIMDSDLQHSMDISLKMIGELVENPEIDVVYAQNDRREGSWRRSQLARLFYKLINSSQRFDIPENAGDFRVMRGAVARALTSVRDKRRFNKGLFAWAGFRQKAVLYSPENRAGGTSKWTRFNLIAFSLEGFTSFSVIPLRVISLIGLLGAFAGLAYGVKVLFEVLFYGIAVPGYPSIMVAVVLLGGLNLALLGLIGEYVWVTLSESKDRPVYIVRDVLHGNAAERVAADK
jgi:glycosyltransferase involved in cell wall biosynthesis